MSTLGALLVEHQAQQSRAHEQSTQPPASSLARTLGDRTSAFSVERQVGLRMPLRRAGIPPRQAELNPEKRAAPSSGAVPAEVARWVSSLQPSTLVVGVANARFPMDQAVESPEKRELRRVTQAMSSYLMDILSPEAEEAVLTDEARKELVAWIDRLYTHRAIGKGFSSLVHTIWTVLQDTSASINADRLRLLRDTLERLYANPQLSYAQARSLREELLEARLPVKNRELRARIVETLRVPDK